MPFWKKNLDKYSAKFLNRTQVFVMDCVVSGLSTVAIAIISFLLEQDIFWDRAFVLVWGLTAAAGAPLMFWLLKTHTIIIRHFSFKDTVLFGLAAVGKAGVMALGAAIYGKFNGAVVALLFFDIMLTTVALLAVRLVMIYVYDTYKYKVRELERRDRVLVYGTNDKAVATASRLRGSKRYEVVGLISNRAEIEHAMLADQMVYHLDTVEEFEKAVNDLSRGGRGSGAGPPDPSVLRAEHEGAHRAGGGRADGRAGDEPAGAQHQDRGPAGPRGNQDFDGRHQGELQG